MDALRESIKLRGYAQRDPKIEYQREGFGLFGEMEQRIDDSFAEFVFKFGYPRPGTGPQATSRRVDRSAPGPATRAGSAAEAGSTAADAATKSPGAGARKVGRNDPCTCGSGKKYKKCCGA
jgi:preprotein translocase subunit SecA